jgi:hypothetical protein
MVDNHVDDAAHIFLGGAEDLAAQNTLDFVILEDRNRRRFRTARRCAIGGLVRGGSRGVLRNRQSGSQYGEKRRDRHRIHEPFRAHGRVPWELN